MGNPGTGNNSVAKQRLHPYFIMVVIICLITLCLQIFLLTEVSKSHINTEDNFHPVIIIITIIILVLLLGIGLVWIIRSRILTLEAFQTKSDELELYFANSIDMLCIADTKGFFRRLNPEWEKVLGYHLSELEGKAFIEFVHPEDVVQTIAATRHLATSQKIQSFINRYRHKDGTYRWIEWRSYPVGDMIYASARDITERKRTEEELQENIDRVKAFSEATNEGIVISDNGIVVEANKQFLNILGYTDFSEIVGKSILEELTPPESKEAVMQHILSNNTEPYETTSYRKDKSIFPIEIRGRAMMIKGKKMRVTTFRDLSDQKKAEQEMRETDLWLRDSQRNSHIGSYNYEIVADRWKSSDELDTIFGISPDFDKNSVGWLKLIHPDHQQEMTYHLLEHVMKQHNIFDKEYRIIRQNDGEVRWVHGVGNLNFDNNGNPIQMVGTIADITDQRKSEEALRRSELMYRLLFENMTSGFALHEVVYDGNGNPEDLRFLEVNTMFEEVNGIKGEDIRGKKLKEAISDVDDEFLNKVNAVLRGETKYFVHYIERYNKYLEFIWYEPVKGQIATFFNDITDRVRAENALRLSEQKFFNIYNLSPDMVGITQQSDGKILDGNPAMAKLTGYSHEEYIGKSTLELGLWANSEDRSFALATLKEKGEIKNFEIGMRIKDGTVLTCLFSATTLSFNDEPCLLFVVNDITERKKVETALRESETKARLFVEHTPLPIAMFDRDMRYIMVSKRWSEDYKLGDQPLIGRTHYEVFPEVPERWKADHQRVLAGEIYRMEADRFEREDGSIQWLRYELHPWRKNDGQVGGIVMFTEDITERKIAEATILALNENLEKKVLERTNQLAQANKDLESFAYSVSHDLRAPLRHIDGFVRLMYSKIDNPNSQTVNYFEKIKVSSNRMSGMIDNLLSFSRLGRRELIVSSVDLNVVIKEIIEQLKPDIGNRNINWNISKLPKIKGDKNLLQIAFENLIANAIKYTSKKEKAMIEIGVSEESNNQLEVFIKDNGVGFNMAYADKLFGVFQRLHSSEEFEGIGIGLANVKQIVLKHNGAIRVDGKVNEGAIFYITLPK